MKSYFIFYVFLVVGIIGCGADEEPPENEIPDNMTITSISSFSAAGETHNFNITSNLDWVINNNADWISINPSSGSNNANVNVTVSENPTPNMRTQAINISGGNILRNLQSDVEKTYQQSKLDEKILSLRNGAQTALAIIASSIEARESKGAHYIES